jgi:tetratricopeptide (TPR) repeat protein
MKYLLVALILLSSFSLLTADEVQIQFERANQHYRDGDYQNAVVLYEKIIKSGYQSADLYYNLANTYFKLDSLSNAILFYERAKRISPNDDDINYNLKIANLKVVDKIEPLPKLFFIEWINGLGKLFSSGSWAIATLIGLWIGTVCFAIFRISRTSISRRISFFGGIVFLFIFSVSLGFSIQQAQIEKSENMAIIFSPNAKVKSSPDENGTDLFILHEGVKVEVLDKVENWRKIKLADGKVGWLPDETVEII